VAPVSGGRRPACRRVLAHRCPPAHACRAVLSPGPGARCWRAAA